MVVMTANSVARHTETLYTEISLLPSDFIFSGNSKFNDWLLISLASRGCRMSRCSLSYITLSSRRTCWVENLIHHLQFSQPRWLLRLLPDTLLL